MKAFLKSYKGSRALDLEHHQTLVVIFDDGSEIEVELFERSKNRLSVRTSTGSIIVHPCVTNVIEVEGEFKRIVNNGGKEEAV